MKRRTPGHRKSPGLGCHEDRLRSTEQILRQEAQFCFLRESRSPVENGWGEGEAEAGKAQSRFEMVTTRNEKEKCPESTGLPCAENPAEAGCHEFVAAQSLAEGMKVASS